MIQNSENHTLIDAHTYYGEVSDCLRTPPPSPPPPLPLSLHKETSGFKMSKTPCICPRKFICTKVFIAIFQHITTVSKNENYPMDSQILYSNLYYKRQKRYGD